MNWLYYLIELNLYLILFYGFYSIFLRKEKSFNPNRWFLMGSLISSFLIPLIKLDWLKNDSLGTFSTSTSITLSEIIVNTQQQNFFAEGLFNFLYTNFWVILYCSGACVMILNLVINIRSIYKTIKNYPRVIKDGYTEISLPNPDEAFTFGRFLCIGNKSSLSIYRHELAHITQKHYIDLWIIEFVSVICWFNPVYLLYRGSIKITHEYLADAEVCKEINAVDYAETLVSNLFQTNTNLLTHSFYTPRNLKNRLFMLKKNTSSKWALLKYAMVLPLCLSFIFISSSAFISKQNIEDLSQELKETSANAVENIVSDMRPTEETVLKADKSVGEKQKHSALAKLPAKLSIKAPVRDTTESEEIYYSVDESPVFPGGMDKIGTFIGQNLKYPTEARKKGTQGRVIVSFVIQKDGLVNDAKILEGIGDGCDEEALRVVNLMPKWKPGIKNGKPVNVHFNLPIMYRTDKTSSAKLPDNVLYVVDGTIVTDKNVVESLSPDKIESVNVLKGKSATDKYGDKGKDGVIEITLKK